MHIFDETSSGIILRVRLTPSSSSCRLGGIFVAPNGDGFLKICVVSVAEKGKANRELINWLAQQLQISKSDVHIIAGELDRYKKILITANKDLILPRLTALVEKK